MHDVGWFSLVQPHDNEPGALWLNLFFPGAASAVLAGETPVGYSYLESCT